MLTRVLLPLTSILLFVCLHAQPPVIPAYDPTPTDQEKSCTKQGERCFCSNAILTGTCESDSSGKLTCQCCQQQGNSCSCGTQNGTCDYIALACSCDKNLNDDADNTADQDEAASDDGSGDGDDDEEEEEKDGDEPGEIIIDVPEAVIP